LYKHASSQQSFAACRKAGGFIFPATTIAE
jgi:hypothetical protein